MLGTRRDKSIPLLQECLHFQTQAGPSAPHSRLQNSVLFNKPSAKHPDSGSRAELSRRRGNSIIVEFFLCLVKAKHSRSSPRSGEKPGRVLYHGSKVYVPRRSTQNEAVITMTSVLGKQRSCESHGWFASGYNGKSGEEISKSTGSGDSPAPAGGHTGAGAAAHRLSAC